jgi:hypothetical protein
MPPLSSPLTLFDQIPRLTAERRSGRLRVRSAAGDRTLFFVAGTPTLATSTIPGERIAETLERRGQIAPGEIGGLLAEAKRAGRRFDAHLVAIGRIDREMLNRTISDLSLSIVASLLRESEGEPLFTALDRPVDDEVRIGRPTAVVWSMAIERIPEDRTLRRIAQLESPPLLTRNPFLRLAIVPADESDLVILRAADGVRSAEELVRLHKGGERRALRLLGWGRLAGLFLPGGGGAAGGGPVLPQERLPWNLWEGTDLRRSAVSRFRSDEIAERERVLCLLDGCADGLPAAGLEGEAAWSAAARLHPDHAHRDLFRDLALRLGFLFPRLFEGKGPGRAPAEPDERELRIRRRKHAGNHVELAELLAAAGQGGRALDLLARAAEIDPARADLATRFRDLLGAHPHLRGDVQTLLRTLARTPGSSAAAILAAIG